MTAQMEPSVMDVDSDHSPSVKSDNSSILFKDDYATLPSTGHLSHAHIVDLDECVDLAKDDGMVKLQDAVVTTLFHVSPDTLRSFLSPTVNAFKAVFGKKDTQLVIWRRGLEVFVGTFENHTGLKVYGFEHVAGFLIGYDGSWHLKVTAGNAFANTKWPEVWAGKFESYGGVAKMTVESDGKEMAKRASKLGESMLSNKYWELKMDIKTT